MQCPPQGQGLDEQEGCLVYMREETLTALNPAFRISEATAARDKSSCQNIVTVSHKGYFSTHIPSRMIMLQYKLIKVQIHSTNDLDKVEI